MSVIKHDISFKVRLKVTPYRAHHRLFQSADITLTEPTIEPTLKIQYYRIFLVVFGGISGESGHGSYFGDTQSSQNIHNQTKRN